MITLSYFIPVAKKLYRIQCIAKDFNPEHAIEVGFDNLGDIIDNIREARLSHPRSYKRLPQYIKFVVMNNGQPGVAPTRKLGEFRIYLETREVEIVKNWMRRF
jgi:hypothetical protein